jgi:Oxidoreductase family, C-terminal alpha/beta domain
MRVGHGEVVEQRPQPVVDQFAAEMDHFSLCVLEGTAPHTPGEEGLRDMRIITAIYEAARSGETVPLTPVRKALLTGERPAAPSREDGNGRRSGHAASTLSAVWRSELK